MKPSLLPCECDDGSCKQCKTLMELNNLIEKTSIIYRDNYGNITNIIPTRTVMDFKRIMKQK